MSSSTTSNGSDDVAPLEYNDNVGSSTYLIDDDRLLNDDEQAASDSLEDLDKPYTEPDDRHHPPCLNRTGVVVVGAAVVGVFVVVGVVVVVILSVLSLHSASKVGHHDAAEVATGEPSAPVQRSRSVVVNLALHENCTTKVVGSVENGVRSFKVGSQLFIVLLIFAISVLVLCSCIVRLHRMHHDKLLACSVCGLLYAFSVRAHAVCVASCMHSACGRMQCVWPLVCILVIT